MVTGYNSVINQPAWKLMRNMNLSPSQSILPSGLTMIGDQVTSNIFYYTNPSSLYQMFDVPFDHNIIDQNLIFHGGQVFQVSCSGDVGTHKGPELLHPADINALGLDQHSIVADPEFVDAAHDDYRLQPDSPAYQLGFKDIPISKIGPYQDERRASWPVVEMNR
jgi:hypothetical protein